MSAATAIVRLAVRVRADDAELALARLLPVFGDGVEERELGADVEYALYGEPAALPSEAALRALAGALPIAVEVAPAPQADGWETAWHGYLRRVTGVGWAVRPPWLAGRDDDLVIDPGSAFGAGTHATTRMCLDLLGGVAREARGSLCDWGSGTGVLALRAARLGFAPVAAVELDADAAALVSANALANDVDVAVQWLDVTRAVAPAAETVVANLTQPLLCAAAAVQPRPRRLIASGMLAGQADAVAAAWAPLTERSRELSDGWAALVLEAAS